MLALNSAVSGSVLEVFPLLASPVRSLRASVSSPGSVRCKSCGSDQATQIVHGIGEVRPLADTQREHKGTRNTNCGFQHGHRPKVPRTYQFVVYPTNARVTLSPLCDCILECAAHPAWGKHPSLPWGREMFLLFSLSVAGTMKRQGWLSAWQLGEAAWVFPLC